MAKLYILSKNHSISSQKINPLITKFINGKDNDLFVIDNPENLEIVSHKAGHNLQFFLKGWVEPSIVLQDYFQSDAFALIEHHMEKKSFIYQPQQDCWQPIDQPVHWLGDSEVTSEMEAVLGGEGAIGGVPPLVWGFGELSNCSDEPFFVDTTIENQIESGSAHEAELWQITPLNDELKSAELESFNYGDDWLIIDRYQRDEVYSEAINIPLDRVVEYQYALVGSASGEARNDQFRQATVSEGF